MGQEGVNQFYLQILAAQVHTPLHVKMDRYEELTCEIESIIRSIGFSLSVGAYP